MKKIYRVLIIVVLFLFFCFLAVFLILRFKLTQKNISKPAEFISYIQNGDRNLPKIALTFDADMTPYMLEELKTGKIKSFYNQKIVEILEKENVKASIFMAGLWVEAYPEVSRQLAQNPLFEIANHSYSHPAFTRECFSLPSMPKWGTDSEFIKSQESIKKITGATPKFFRFPGGCHLDDDIKLANKYGLTVVDWDVASSDSFNENLPSIINNIKNKTQNGSIIVFHFNGNKNAPKTGEALESVIPYLRGKGFEFVKLSELLGYNN